MRTHIRFAFIVATKDRPLELKRMLESLDSQSTHPDKIIIVDGGTQPLDGILRMFPSLNISYSKSEIPSASRQRNLGLRRVDEDTNLIGFLDDDIVLEKDALETMAEYWREASSRDGGAGFNIVNHPPMALESLKRLPLAEKIGFYSRRPGLVLKSGFQTLIGTLSNNAVVGWLPSTACVYRKEALSWKKFDEWFSGYSYLEDLDFSYAIGKRYRLSVVAGAKYHHFPNQSPRMNSIEFGKREIRNRLYFVRKNRELSVMRCYAALVLRVMMSLGTAVGKLEIKSFKRAWGNIEGLVDFFRP